MAEFLRIHLARKKAGLDNYGTDLTACNNKKCTKHTDCVRELLLNNCGGHTACLTN